MTVSGDGQGGEGLPRHEGSAQRRTYCLDLLTQPVDELTRDVISLSAHFLVWGSSHGEKNPMGPGKRGKPGGPTLDVPRARQSFYNYLRKT